MDNEHGLLATSEQFHAAVLAVLQGDAAPMLAVWSHSDEASYCDTRGEIVTGWLALEAYWRQAAASNATAPARLTATGQVKYAVVNGDLAYVVALEEVRQEGSKGEPSVMRGRATHVYRREEDTGGEWRLLHRHADSAPKGGEPERA